MVNNLANVLVGNGAVQDRAQGRECDGVEKVVSEDPWTAQIVRKHEKHAGPKELEENHAPCGVSEHERQCHEQNHKGDSGVIFGHWMLEGDAQAVEHGD